MAHARLQPQWIVRWLHNPQAVDPGTKMPSFFETSAEGVASGGPDDVLSGSSEDQIKAIRDYLMVLNHVDQVLAKQKKDGTLAAAQAQGAVAVPQAN
jgi:hypothetical protein